MRRPGLRSWNAPFSWGLLASGALCLLSLARLPFLEVEEQALLPTPLGVLVLLALLLFLAASVVPALLRAWGLRSAWQATRVGTAILLFWFPVGLKNSSGR